MAMFNVQRAIIPKVYIPELRFMCSAHCLIALYIRVKFLENISNSIRVVEWSQIMEALTKGHSNFRGYNMYRSYRKMTIYGHFSMYLYMFVWYLD